MIWKRIIVKSGQWVPSGHRSCFFSALLPAGPHPQCMSLSRLLVNVSWIGNQGLNCCLCVFIPWKVWPLPKVNTRMEESSNCIKSEFLRCPHSPVYVKISLIKQMGLMYNRKIICILKPTTLVLVPKLCREQRDTVHSNFYLVCFY